MGVVDMKLYVVEYFGFTAMDKRFTKPMLPWILAEIKKGTSDKICLGVNEGCVQAYPFSRQPDAPLFAHPLAHIMRFTHVLGDTSTFMYLVRDPAEQLLFCYLFQAADPADVSELFQAMKEQGREIPAKERSLSSAATLTSLCADISPSSSHFFEVLYIGKIKLSHKKVPESFIDDALEKFRINELEKNKNKVGKESGNKLENLYRRGSQDSGVGSSEQFSGSSPTILSSNTNSSMESDDQGNSSSSSETMLVTSVSENNSGTVETSKTTIPPQEPMRNRASSMGNSKDFKKSDTHTHSDNRTMLFQVGRTDLRLISPDRKQILLHKHLKDVASCIQGNKSAEHFGFICRETAAECYIGYVFKCQSDSVADDVVGAIRQAFVATCEAQRREKLPVFSCEHCPMVWYHKLCAELEGQNDRRIQTTIIRRLEQLPEDEQSIIKTKLSGAETNSIREQNEFLMMLLRAHCESKQARHMHDTAENRHEFLNQYLGGGTIFMKAKRSLTSSFDQLLKRKGSKDDFGPLVKEMSLPVNSSVFKEGIQSSNIRASPTTEAPEAAMRPRSSTVGSSSGEEMKQEMGVKKSGSNTSLSSNGGSQTQLAPQKGSPMMNIFLKVGNSPKNSEHNQSLSGSPRQSGSWRQAIFNRVVTPNKSLTALAEGSEATIPQANRSKEELRALWKKAINQQLLLIRMEKENARLRARQEEATVKRIKLEYDEISPCAREVIEVWDLLVSKESRISAKCDHQMLLQAIRNGVPRSKRGEVWQFLAEQFCLKVPPVDTTNFPNYHMPYESLLKQLTSHQHSILIDLGRTFPSHTYFSSPLGPGQLALFNLLKAYSLLDPEVGYCQGLSFVAGVLLLHMAEEHAFLMLRHLMFRRGLRKQYLPDMAALQVQLYQLSRLLHDQHPDLDAHFDTHEVAPTLYAAPWILTVFASQFPLGFVTRVFDLLFLESPNVIFRVALALLAEHKTGLLACDSFEEIMEYLKTTCPNIDKPMLDRIMKQIFALDVSKQLHEYEVEYHVLQEEMSSPRVETEALRKLEAANKNLAQDNQILSEQLEIASSNIQRLENARTTQQNNISKLESQVRSLEVSVATMGKFISSIIENHPEIEIPGEVRRIVSQLTVAERRKNSTSIVPHIKSSSSDSSNLKDVTLKVVERKDNQPPHIKKNFNGKSMSSGNEVLNKSQQKPEEKVRNTPYPLKSALSSPNLSQRMSSFFSNTHNHIKQQKLNALSSDSIDSVVSLSVPDIKKIANSQNSNQTLKLEIDKVEPISKEVGKPNKHSKTEKNENDENTFYVKPDFIPVVGPPARLRPSQSSFELTTNILNPEESGDSGNVTPTSPITHIHPLDDTCVDVNVSYGGTTKLRTIRPLRAQLSRNISSDSLTLVKSGSDGISTNVTSTSTEGIKSSNSLSEPQSLSALCPSKTGVLTR